MILSEAVDGNPPREGLTDTQVKAWQWLTKCYRKLGGDGSALVHDALIGNMTAKQIATARGLCVADERYISRRIGECLDTLAVTFGYSSR